MNLMLRSSSCRDSKSQKSRILPTILQIATSLAIVIILCLPTSADECESKFAGLTVSLFSHGDEWSLTWQTDGVHKGKVDFWGNRKEGVRTNEFDSKGNWRSRILPQTLLNPDKQFNVPFDTSQNGAFLIAGVHAGEVGSLLIHPCRQFAIVDLKQLKIIKTIDTKDNVESLAWAPDGKYFIVLHKQDVTEQVFKGPIDWLAEREGHGNYYWTFYLTVYKPDGTPQCTEQIAKKLPNAIGYIDLGPATR